MIPSRLSWRKVLGAVFQPCALLAVAFFAAGLLLPRCARRPAPAREELREAEHVQSVEVERPRVEQLEAKQATTRVVTRTVIAKPDGTRIERVREAGGSTASSSSTTTTAEAVRLVTADKTREIARDGPQLDLRPRWRVTAGPEWLLSDLQLMPSLALGASWRPFGALPVWIYGRGAFAPGRKPELRAGAELAIEF